ncbi:ABC transporter substrate-binding protein [Cellulosimicrobium cellulans]|uniref:ABC transporter substrate-binding protein n=1 Tax=Cellulosimicrobium cellulans TaxID=1710 RepID=UPI000848B711|nr:extracellular solute-binding protein [Cellulosimicrobium cellulans]
MARRRGSAAARTGAVVGALALAAGCAQGTGETDAEIDFSAEGSGSGELSVMGFGTGDEIGEVRYERAVQGLDGVDVRLSEGELDIQAFLSAVASGNPPDVVYANRDQIGTFASRDAILPLDECIDAEGVDMDAFVDSAVEQVTFAGSVYGIPEFNQVQVTMANADLLDAAGLTVEDVNGSDREAVTAANEALMRADGGTLSVIGYDSKLPEFLPLWAKAAGADMLSEDGRTAQLDSPEVVESLGWAVGVYDAQGGFPAVKTYRDSADFFGSGNQFATGVLGAMPMEQWYINVLAESSPDAPMAFDAVRTPDGEPIAFASGSAWAVPRGSENPAAACRFARLMTETDAWTEAAQARADARAEEGLVFTGVLTGNEEADELIRTELVPDDAPQPWQDAIDAMYAANDATFALPANPADNEFETAWQDAVNRVLNGQQAPADAMAQAQEEAQAALDDAWAQWDEEE